MVVGQVAGALSGEAITSSSSEYFEKKDWQNTEIKGNVARNL
jgi:hypothetical protein